MAEDNDSGRTNTVIRITPGQKGPIRNIGSPRKNFRKNLAEDETLIRLNDERKERILSGWKTTTIGLEKPEADLLAEDVRLLPDGLFRYTDRTPPVSEAYVGSGWHTEPAVDVSLGATDPAPGTGVAAVWASVDGMAEQIRGGACDACQLRRKGFAEAGVPDPTLYVTK